MNPDNRNFENYQAPQYEQQTTGDNQNQNNFHQLYQGMCNPSEMGPNTIQAYNTQ